MSFLLLMELVAIMYNNCNTINTHIQTIHTDHPVELKVARRRTVSRLQSAHSVDPEKMPNRETIPMLRQLIPAVLPVLFHTGFII